MTLRRDGLSRRKSSFYGPFSGMVESLEAVIVVLVVVFIEPLLPYALKFVADAMIFVVVEEAIPGPKEKGNSDLASMSLTIYFTVMMILDVVLG